MIQNTGECTRQAKDSLFNKIQGKKGDYLEARTTLFGKEEELPQTGSKDPRERERILKREV